jgi:endonuclease/exonuclease/phosphatase family metal-dependent hydrolase
MIGRVEWLLLEMRRRISRNEWIVRLFGLPRTAGTETQPGLVLIQIDGLSRRQLERALSHGRMPFLRSLMKREGYRLETLYSGLPSSTPSFQGEFFYGVKSAVPAFGYQHRETKQLMSLYAPSAAVAIQRRLSERGVGLLSGGSCYLDLFTGGARESHFCPATLGWDSVLRSANPLNGALFLLLHGWSLVRVGALLAVEFALSVTDCVRGLVAGQDLWKELKFIPTRVAISILLRELVTIGATVDAARGLPVIHLNYLGYDEQAHRRGPDSAFAHWSLKGIDDAVKRVWRAARRSSGRDYEVWIYSDHGQERTVPYAVENGRSLHDAVEQLFNERVEGRPGRSAARGVQLKRAQWLGGRLARWLSSGEEQGGLDPPQIVLTALGPLAHLYLHRSSDPRERARFARLLVERANVPLVLVPDEPDTVQAWTRAGEFRLPEDAKTVLGAGHPFLEEAAQDLAALCHHPDAGDLVLSGWRPTGAPVSFPNENGAHAGPGSEETRAFALLPAAAPVFGHSRPLRPLDLREGALRVMGRAEPSWSPGRAVRRPSAGPTLRLMTYNVHICRGMDGKVSPERIARVIAHYDPDIVALQELDVGRLRTGGVHQAQLIAQLLEMEFHFHPALTIEEEKYGDAVLSRLPMRLVKATGLPGLARRGRLVRRPFREPRGALWVAVGVNGGEVQLINTHLGLSRRERLLQTDALLGHEWLAHPECRSPVILCGDFNALPGSAVCKRLNGPLRDAQRTLSGHEPKATWFGRFPIHRIDHIFIDRSTTVLAVEVPRTALTRIASDHLPLIADLGLP